MSFTNTWEAEVLNHLFNGATLTLPTDFYIGLATSATVPAEDGTGITEPAGTAGYQRVAVTRNATNFPSATDNTSGGFKVSNGTTITFPKATADWGTITHFFITNVQVGGTGQKIYVIGDITDKAVLNGDTASFGANGLTVSLA